MKSTCHLPLMAFMLMTGACERNQTLLNEREKVERAIQDRQNELIDYDARFAQIKLQPYEAAAWLQRRNAELAQHNSVLEQELAALNQKCVECETALSDLRPMVEAYMIKHNQQPSPR